MIELSESLFFKFFAEKLKEQLSRQVNLFINRDFDFRREYTHSAQVYRLTDQNQK